jgi:hypothetical protein
MRVPVKTKGLHNGRPMPPEIPDRALARVDRTKLVDYLLSPTHADGRTKAEFFTRFGFRADRWQDLAEALRALGATNPISGVVESAHGLRYTVDGTMRAPDGRAPWVRTVWIVERGSMTARLITAHPLSQRGAHAADQ